MFNEEMTEILEEKIRKHSRNIFNSRFKNKKWYSIIIKHPRLLNFIRKGRKIIKPRNRLKEKEMRSILDNLTISIAVLEKKEC